MGKGDVIIYTSLTYHAVKVRGLAFDHATEIFECVFFRLQPNCLQEIILHVAARSGAVAHCVKIICPVESEAALISNVVRGLA